MSVRIIQADVLEGLAQLPSDSVHCVVTSPPYYGLRDYGTGQWEGGNPNCEHIERSRKDVSRSNGLGKIAGYRDSLPADNAAFKSLERQFQHECAHCGARRVDSQLGLEPTLAEHIAKLVEVFAEVRRVLRPDGVCFLNYGDVYAGSWGAQGRPNGDDRSPVSTTQVAAAPSRQTGTGSLVREPALKPKDLMLIPERLSVALQEQGWWVRDRIVWHKPNPMPSSVTDRCTPSYELVYMLTKRKSYWWDAEAIREPAERAGEIPGGNYASGNSKSERRSNLEGELGAGQVPANRNARNVWTIATHPMPEAHFATFPPELVRRCLLAACPERVCAECGAGWVREVERTPMVVREGPGRQGLRDAATNGTQRTACTGTMLEPPQSKTLGWHPSCTCQADWNVPSTRPGVVLDPFGGSGTVGLVADQMNRNAILIELNKDYCEMARRRIEGDAPLFSDVALQSAEV